MAHKSVFCIALSEAQASEIVNLLKVAGFSNNDISALLPDKTGTKDFGHEQHTKAPEGAVAGATAGAVAGAAIGWLTGIGLLALPGMGPLLAAGPVLSALSVAAIGGLIGGLIGAFIGAGVPEFEARRYQGKIRQGNILISVHCEDETAARRVRDIFSRSGARDVSTRGEARVRGGRHDLEARHAA